jgi:hypothetical protein
MRSRYFRRVQTLAPVVILAIMGGTTLIRLAAFGADTQPTSQNISGATI